MIGFCYASDGGDSPLRAAKAGGQVRIAERKPPWIVVDHDISSIVVAIWPGRLWCVEILDAVTDDDFEAAGSSKPYAYARYTPAVAVRVIAELPVSRLFGARGEAVRAAIAQTGQLTIEKADQLAAARHVEADKAYSRAWIAWLARQGAPSLNEQDFSAVLAIGGASMGNSRSPTGYGFSVIWDEIEKRARLLSGKAAFFVNRDGELRLGQNGRHPRRPCLTPPWRLARPSFPAAKTI